MFPLILGEPCSGAERLAGLGRSAEPGQQVAADGVKQVVVAEVQPVEEAQRRGRAVDLGYRDRSVERNDRARVETARWS